MKYLIRILKWIGGLLLLGIVGILIFIQTVDFSIDQEEIDAAFAGLLFEPEFNTIQLHGKSLHYVAVGDTGKPVVVFVHGSPGTWDNFLYFLTDTTLLNTYRMIAVDRPGFGKAIMGYRNVH